ncbi:hypothetical protein C6Y56_19765 [Pseudomonas fluorescens]|uniref:Uncharacterized protein n=1 Tax=Pseudomonas fluorescens TaxID=294 RepID=A0A7Z3C6W0_PSEFL|nr:hypothetical protein C6Y56_19765 [Pseudomonas fluorescens]
MCRRPDRVPDEQCSAIDSEATECAGFYRPFVKPTLAREGVDLDIKVFTDFIREGQEPVHRVSGRPSRPHQRPGTSRKCAPGPCSPSTSP